MGKAAIERHTLYICYFGLRQPLVQTQVIPYLQEIARSGIRVSLLTFEPDFQKSWTPEQKKQAADELADRGIELYMLPYHKRLSALATAYDVVNGVRFLRGLIKRQRIDVLHGRVHVATLMGALARRSAQRKPKLVFDIRGFFPEEYTDAGVWPENGALYRAAKKVESWLMEQADGFVILTQKARQMIWPESGSDVDASEMPTAAFSDEQGRPIEVIPCCVDFSERFGPESADDAEDIKDRLGLNGRFVFAHVGALGGLYLTEKIVDFLSEARRGDPSVFAMFLTQSDPAHVIQLLTDRGFGESDRIVARVPSSAVPAYLAASNAGLSFVKATYATQSRSPTKIPEYLAAGLPVVANGGVGDVDELITTENVGVLVEGFDQQSYRKALLELGNLGDVAERSRAAAIKRFDLATIGGMKYRRLYERLFA